MFVTTCNYNFFFLGMRTFKSYYQQLSTNIVKIRSSKDNQWMLNLSGYFEEEQEILHGFKMSSHRLLIGFKGKIFIIQ